MCIVYWYDKMELNILFILRSFLFYLFLFIHFIIVLAHLFCTTLYRKILKIKFQIGMCTRVAVSSVIDGGLKLVEVEVEESRVCIGQDKCI